MSTQGTVSPARRRGLADEVADRIREGILTGAYEPGRQLREVELSTVMDVSRGPVREALRLLEHEGLVHVTWHRGATVTRFSRRDVAELDSLRAALEGLAVHEVAHRATEDDFAALDRAAEAVARAVGAHELAQRDVDFHDAVFAAAHHERLRRSWECIRRQVHLFLLTRISRSEELRDGCAEEHRELVGALRTRDADAANALFSEHRRRVFELSDSDDWSDLLCSDDCEGERREG
ncbi:MULTISPECIES: GntR family transcriptional regulator [Actinosynnema]|uniref:GntR family transcriptional regulator n=1 Tax=Actinosynnema TaxID=40566 RepID=UPI0020A5C110|nr:GntR family transcriptional regulator [Actinosynnema pretiosum]MCP2096789.1 transcriptional regulator, GntR family [Actinosynnema pretiosum]